jgi:uncharacterized protein YbbK (DUF523 family)
MERILMSACLVGQRVRYNATDAKESWTNLSSLERWQAEGRIVAFCPELAGGFPVPRPPAEIVGDADTESHVAQGSDVLAGHARVLEVGGADVTEFFVRGAQLALHEAQRLGIRVAVLKEESPSCTIHRLYSGDFSGKLKPGRGVTAQLLSENGIQVFSEEEFEAVETHLQHLESPAASTQLL